MLTPKQAAANAANAHPSTGPTTPEGKARSSRNALKHGLTAAEVVVEPGREQEFPDYRDALLHDLGPQGATEMDIFNRLVHAGWTLQRIREIESGMMREGILDPRPIAPSVTWSPRNRRHIPVLASVNDLTKRTQPAREILTRQIEDFLTAPAPVQNEPAARLAIVEEIA